MQHFTRREKIKHLLGFPVIIASLGYFVDIYDLLLFGIVRIPSLKDMGLEADTVGTMILNYQMVGLVLGGIIWGVFGDKKGRLSVLFGSIVVYSLANIANGLVQSIDQYIVCRFNAGMKGAAKLGMGKVGQVVTGATGVYAGQKPVMQ